MHEFYHDVEWYGKKELDRTDEGSASDKAIAFVEADKGFTAAILTRELFTRWFHGDDEDNGHWQYRAHLYQERASVRRRIQKSFDWESKHQVEAFLNILNTTIPTLAIDPNCKFLHAEFGL